MWSVVVFIKESIEELRYKITWPTHEESQRMNVLFMVGLTVITVIVGSLNLGWSKAFSWLYDKF